MTSEQFADLTAQLQAIRIILSLVLGSLLASTLWRRY